MTTNEAAVRRATVLSVLTDLYPQSIRNALLSRKGFREKYGFETDAQITFGNTDVGMTRSQLFTAGRRAFQEPPRSENWLVSVLDWGFRRQPDPVTVLDTQDREWKLEITNLTEGEAALVREEMRLFLPELWMLLPEAQQRLVAFNEAANRYNLPKEVCDVWQQKLTDAVLRDEEVDELLDELKHTPIHAISQIENEIEEGSSGFDTLVPLSSRYFGRLVGEYQEGADLEKYVEDVLATHIQELLTWNPVEGLKLALLLGSHSSIAARVDLNSINIEHVAKVYEFLASRGDRVSQLGAIEIALPIIDQYVELAPFVASMIEQIRDDDPDSERSGFRLLSALIILVDGEMSRSRVFEHAEPFWRRLAAIAQASLIERCMRPYAVDISSFSEWAHSGRGEWFYLQTLCDLRREPRWMPEFVSPQQLKAEFIGRLLHVGRANEAKLDRTQFKALLLDDAETSIQHHARFPRPYFCGPLEGGTQRANDVPEEIVALIDKALEAEPVDTKSFTALINSALLFKMDASFAERAVVALRRARHYVRAEGDSELILSLVDGLAAVAAGTRNGELADELRVLVRRSIHTGGIEFPSEHIFRVGMVAAASHEDRREWCTFVGEWLTELAFGNLTEDEAKRLHSHVRCLGSIVPELWATMGRAEAALAAISD